MTITVKVTGDKAELDRELSRVSAAVEPARGLEDSVTLAVGMLHRFMIGIVHVDTGRLKNSIHWDTRRARQSVIGAVGTNVEYAIYENARGSDHAFLDRTEREEGRRVAEIFHLSITGRGGRGRR